jgi:hypothetical protein
MSYYTNLPPKTATGSDSTTLQAFESYYTAPLEVPVSTFDSIKGYFELRGFDKLSADATAIAIIRQAKADGVNPMSIIDTLKGLDSIQLSNVVSEILNYSRFKTSYLGYAAKSVIFPEIARNIESPEWIGQYEDSVLLTENGIPITDEAMNPLKEGE